MALISKNKNWLIALSCLAIVVPTSVSFYRPLYVAIYEWKEPHFIPPVYLEKQHIELRNDDWGDGHFGARRNGGRKHKGIDIKAAVGTVVYAAKSGTVEIGNNQRGMGKYVKIAHPDGSSTLYGHLEDWLVAPHTWVRQGQVIGLVGKSGNAAIPTMEPHLHFEIRYGMKTVDPLQGYLKETTIEDR